MIPDRWYPILESARLRRKPVGIKRLGERLVLWRAPSGEAVAFPATCPHRGAALDQGRVVDGQLACPWHGFRYGADGRCTLMPCEGAEARVSEALHLRPRVVREAQGLVWLWFGEARDRYPEIAYFEEAHGDLSCTSQASYVLPYHYSRMVETNLDIHHTAFVHGAFVPVGARVDPFEASIEGDRIRTSGELRKPGKSKGVAFRADALLPCLGLIQLTAKVHIFLASTPVDDDHTWLWFRYQQDYTRLPVLRRLLSWLIVRSELWLVQPQDWRIFAGMAGGTIDDVTHRYVRADQGIGLYRKRRRELLAAAAHVKAS